MPIASIHGSRPVPPLHSTPHLPGAQKVSDVPVRLVLLEHVALQLLRQRIHLGQGLRAQGRRGGQGVCKAQGADVAASYMCLARVQYGREDVAIGMPAQNFPLTNARPRASRPVIAPIR